MAAQRYMIAPYERDSGLQTNREPWLIPDKAFAQMNNAYVYRGRVRKRLGELYMGNATSQLASRFRMQLTPAGATVTTPINLALGQMFSIGDDIFTVQTTTIGQFLLTTSAVTAQVAAVNQVTFSAIASTVYFYPNLPVMGLPTLETSDRNNNITMGFDTRFSYEYTSSGWERRDNTASWTGTDSNFFYSTNYKTTSYTPVLFSTNNVDPVRWLDTTGPTWNNLQPQYSATVTDVIETAKIVIPFQSRLLLLNTQEFITSGGVGSQRFRNRCRFSEVGDPTAATAWRQDNTTAGAIDAATSEEIIGADFIKNHLIVFFENSTWEIVYTGVESDPFAWQQINSELGAESGFSIVPFDKAILGIAGNGVHACNGSNVERIDSKIPDTVFGFQNTNEGPFRVYGVRDYFTELVYWAYPGENNTDTTRVYPNKVLVYNYDTGTWAIFDDSITCFGYYQPVTGRTWAEADMTWEEAAFLWNSPTTQAEFRKVIAGNQQGYTFALEPGEASNIGALQITNITTAVPFQLTIINHNLVPDDYIQINDAVWSDAGNYLNNVIVKVLTVVDSDNITLDPNVNDIGDLALATYEGGATATRVSRIDIKTKEFNPFVSQDRNIYLSRVDFQVSRTSNGEFSVDYFISTNTEEMTDAADQSGALLGTGIVETRPYPTIDFEAGQTRLFHPLYLQADGEFVQLRLYLSDSQMADNNITNADWTLHSMTLFATPTASRLQ